jgi:hypothetical protein
MGCPADREDDFVVPIRAFMHVNNTRCSKIEGGDVHSNIYFKFSQIKIFPKHAENNILIYFLWSLLKSY